ncbi:ubiquinol-cytochrome C reductase complex CORE protein 2 precursor [Poronia punctata]|nr:ubiquinol-cytochrome C reductase complex CORE protein 2 precursor [Poronia punctata]
MLSRTALSRGIQLAARKQTPSQLRGYAAAAGSAIPTSFAYETTDVAGVKVATRDSRGPTTKLAVVAKAGTRYEPAPGLTVGLEEFAFKDTSSRSAIRITREAELLGGQLTAYHTREALVLEASFLREHIPYFTELLAEVISQTKYTTYEFHEEVERVLHLKQAKLAGDVSALALDAAHSVAFHNGLGATLYPSPSTPLRGYLDEHAIAEYSGAVYNKSNIALIGDGATGQSLHKWTEQFFKALPSSATGSSLSPSSKASTYYGGEQRTSHSGGNALVLAFPGSSFGTFKPEIAVLAALFGGKPNVKWSPGFTVLSKATAGSPSVSASAANLTYSDAGLLAIQINGAAPLVRKTAEEAVKALKGVAAGSISKEDLTKAIAKAKFDALDASQSGVATLVSAGSGIVQTGKPFQIAETVESINGVTADKLKAAAQSLIDGKATVAAVGDLHVLPFAEELGLKV